MGQSIELFVKFKIFQMFLIFLFVSSEICFMSVAGLTGSGVISNSNLKNVNLNLKGIPVPFGKKIMNSITNQAKGPTRILRMIRDNINKTLSGSPFNKGAYSHNFYSLETPPNYFNPINQHFNQFGLLEHHPESDYYDEDYSADYSGGHELTYPSQVTPLPFHSRIGFHRPDFPAERIFVKHSHRSKIKLPIYTTVYSQKIIPVHHPHHPHGHGHGPLIRKRRRRRRGRRRKFRRRRRRPPLHFQQHPIPHPQIEESTGFITSYAPAFITYGPVYDHHHHQPPPFRHRRPHHHPHHPGHSFGIPHFHNSYFGSHSNNFQTTVSPYGDPMNNYFDGTGTDNYGTIREQTPPSPPPPQVNKAYYGASHLNVPSVSVSSSTTSIKPPKPTTVEIKNNKNKGANNDYYYNGAYHDLTFSKEKKETTSSPPRNIYDIVDSQSDSKPTRGPGDRDRISPYRTSSYSSSYPPTVGYNGHSHNKRWKSSYELEKLEKKKPISLSSPKYKDPRDLLISDFTPYEKSLIGPTYKFRRDDNDSEDRDKNKYHYSKGNFKTGADETQPSLEVVFEKNSPKEKYTGIDGVIKRGKLQSKENYSRSYLKKMNYFFNRQNKEFAKENSAMNPFYNKNKKSNNKNSPESYYWNKGKRIFRRKGEIYNEYEDNEKDDYDEDIYSFERYYDEGMGSENFSKRLKFTPKSSFNNNTTKFYPKNNRRSDTEEEIENDLYYDQHQRRDIDLDVIARANKILRKKNDKIRQETFNNLQSKKKEMGLISLGKKYRRPILIASKNEQNSEKVNYNFI